MLKSIEIQDLRGIRHGKLEGFTELNVIVGPNNAGKSTMLDAIALGVHANPQSALADLLHRRHVMEAGNWVVRRAFREEPSQATIYVQTDRPDSDRQTTILRKAATATSEGSALELSFEQTIRHKREHFSEPTFPPPLAGISEVQFLEPLSGKGHGFLPDLLTRLSERGLRTRAEELVRAVLPDLEKLEKESQKGQAVLYLHFPGVIHPVGLAGEGIVRLIKLVFELANATGGVALLEEPETHLHPAAMAQVAKALHEAARRGIQIFLTTHSLDLIDDLLSEFHDADIDRIAVYRVRLEDGELRSSRLSGADAALSRTQIEADLR